MNRSKKLLVLGLLALTQQAVAHGTEDHAKPATSNIGQDHAAAIGQAGDPKKVDRTVLVKMSDDMRFNPSRITVKRNETIRFVLKNVGQLKHEMVLGSINELKEHAALMLKYPEMEHADPNQASVEPGQTGALVWRFTKTGTFDFACLQAGHFDAGMKGQVLVSSAASSSNVAAPKK
jgi:uncharacterized cupredoxin-like copper-binding protein